MTLAKGEVFTKIAHAVLVLGLVFLVAEVHHLRVAVEDVALTSMGSGDEVDRIASSLDRPLGDLAGRIDALTVTLNRSRRAETVTAAAAAEGDSKSVTRPAAYGDGTRAAISRVPLTVDWDSRLESIVTTLEKLDASPRVRQASLPVSQAKTREIQTGAVSTTIAAIRNSPEQKSSFLMMTREQVLDRYGKPSSISIQDRGQVWWRYELPIGTGLLFILYDGRVIQVNG